MCDAGEVSQSEFGKIGSRCGIFRWRGGGGSPSLGIPHLFSLKEGTGTDAERVTEMDTEEEEEEEERGGGEFWGRWRGEMGQKLTK